MEHFVSFVNKFRYLSMSKLPFLSIKDVCLFVCHVEISQTISPPTPLPSLLALHVVEKPQMSKDAMLWFCNV
jgi:hypothetical protein